MDAVADATWFVTARARVTGPRVRRVVRDVLILAGLLFFVARFLVIAPEARTVGADAFAYWALDPARPYALPNGEVGAFLYPPPLVRLFQPFAALSWATFLWLWIALLVGTVIWLGWRRTLLLLAFPPVALELYYANVNLLIAAAIALGFRYPVTWSFVILTKVTPGVGLLWFLARREWRPLGLALAATAAIALASFVVDRALWDQWSVALGRDTTGSPYGSIESPIWLRLPIAVAVVLWGARTNRRWTVPVASTLAMPVLWVASLSVLAALAAINRPELREGSRRSSRSGEA